MPPEAPDAWADVVQLVELSRPTPGVAASKPARRAWLRTARRFTLIVLLPMAVAATYLIGFAANRYESVAQFQLSKPNSVGRGPSATLSTEASPKGLGVTDDSYAVRDFMLSRDAVRLLQRQVDLRAALARAGGDPMWQFPGVFNGHSDEDLYEHYLSLVSVEYESSTGVTTLRVQAFSPQDAARIADALLNDAETLVNQLNERARSDAVQVAEAEVARSRAITRQAQDEVTKFRERNSVIDPTLLSKTVLTTISNLSSQLVDSAAQLDVLLHISPHNPQIPTLRGRVQALQDQIAHERATLAGSNQSLAPQIAEYERLMLEREFAERSFVSALDFLEAARLDAERQQEYLEPIVQPGVPDKARYPKRFLWLSVVALVSLSIFWLFRPTVPAYGGRRAYAA